MTRGLSSASTTTAPVNRFTCATNDPQALSALFEDTLGGDVALLIDDEATRQNILEELTLLSGTSAGIHRGLRSATSTDQRVPHTTWLCGCALLRRP